MICASAESYQIDLVVLFPAYFAVLCYSYLFNFGICRLSFCAPIYSQHDLFHSSKCSCNHLIDQFY